MDERYAVVDGSESGHCCFTASVVDTRKPSLVGNEPYVEIVCECFERKEAEMVASALNAKSPPSP